MATWWEHLRKFDPSGYDYPGTAYFIKAKHFLAPRTPRTINYVVVHITGGPSLTESSAINEFLSDRVVVVNGVARPKKSSAHYIVNREGVVIQLVREAHIAVHVGSMYSVTNAESIGIEHVNPYDGVTTRMSPTEQQYTASARLVRWICRRYGIPMFHNPSPRARGIKGHSEAAPDTPHVHCVDPAWDWDRYIQLVNHPHPLDAILERAGI